MDHHTENAVNILSDISFGCNQHTLSDYIKPATIAVVAEELIEKGVMFPSPDTVPEHKVGDICVYSYSNSDNKSCSIVEIIKMYDDKTVAEIKFHNVFADYSGNGMFKYLLESGKTMNASCKYLHIICLGNNRNE